jgi:hypothetical protein
VGGLDPPPRRGFRPPRSGGAASTHRIGWADALGWRAISRGAMTSATLTSRRGLIVGVGRQCGSAEWIPHRSRGAAGGSPSGHAVSGRAATGVCCRPALPRAWSSPRQARRPVRRPGGMCRASAGACRHAGLTAPVAQRGPALLEELDRYPDDRAEIVRAAWAWSLPTSRWPGVVEPARHLVVVHATSRASAV